MASPTIDQVLESLRSSMDLETLDRYITRMFNGRIELAAEHIHREIYADEGIALSVVEQAIRRYLQEGN